MTFDYVILAAGDFPTHPVPAALLDHRRVVCCDSAAGPFVASGRTPLAVVGDGDSIAPALRRSVRFIQIDEQDDNDLTKAVRHVHALMPGHPRIAIVGATGRREDHTLGNISLLLEYMRMGIGVQMITDHGVFIPCHGTTSIAAADEWWLPQLRRRDIVRQEVSIFNFTCTRLAAEGLDYATRPFTSWWQGTLNYVAAPRFTLQADGDFILYLSFSFREGCSGKV